MKDPFLLKNNPIPWKVVGLYFDTTKREALKYFLEPKNQNLLSTDPIVTNMVTQIITQNA